DPHLETLVAHAHLSLLGTDVGANATAIKEGYSRISAIAYSPEGVFMAKVGPTIGFETALRMKRVATAQWSIMQHQVTDLLARQANGYKDFYFPPELVTVAQDKRCACEECSSAVSPLASLADLIGYATSKLGALKQVGTPKASLLPIYRLYNPSSG